MYIALCIAGVAAGLAFAGTYLWLGTKQALAERALAAEGRICQCIPPCSHPD